MEIHHSFPHRATLAQAKAAAENAWLEYQKSLASFRPTFTWESPTRAHVEFNYKGIKVTGSITIQVTSIDIALKGPYMLKTFEPQAIKVIGDEINRRLGQAGAP
jgi:hypothetical protein